VQLIQGESPDALAVLADSSIDMVLADPPYGTTQCKWDAVIPFMPMWEQLLRVAKPNAAIVMTACQPFTSALVMSAPNLFRYSWVWYKNKASGHLNAKKMPLRAHEDVLVFYRKLPVYNPQHTTGHKPGNHAVRRTSSKLYGAQTQTSYGGAKTRYPRTVLDVPVVNNDGTGEGRQHPTQKPVALMEYMVRTYTNEGDVVLDFAMGSGTTGVACANLGREFIGVEKDVAYFEVARTRVETAVLKWRTSDELVEDDSSSG
jgi:site-specific DNA-methyltransferase (adenine-specific)